MKTKLLFLFALTSVFANAQLTFQKTFGGSSSDIGFSGQQTSDGGYVLAGHTNGFGAGSSDVYVVKTDMNGAILWTKTYGGTSLDNSSTIQQTADGGFVVTGITQSFGSGANDIYVIKTNTNGDTLWTKAYGGTSNEGGNCIQQTTDGGFIIGGQTQSFGNQDGYLIKINSNGSLQWTKVFGGTGAESCYSVRQTSDGGFILTGVTNSFGAGGLDTYLAKTDANGIFLWSEAIGSANGDYGNAVLQASDGGYIMTGSSNGQVFLIKTDSNGGALWQKNYGGTFDFGNSVQQTADGGFVIGGITNTFGSGGDAYLIKTDSNGGTLWKKTYGGTNYDDCGSVSKTSDGGFMIVGNYDNNDFYLIKTDDNGNSGCNETNPNIITGVSTLQFANITMTISSGGVASTTKTTVGSGGTATSLCSTVGVNENNLVDNFVNIYPNPFSSQATLQTANPLINASLTVYNSVGQTVKRIDGLAGQTIVFNRDNLPSGLYFVRLTQDGNTISADKFVIADK